ncbi:hypothetical protein [Psittacicella gerlachiana]|uniref:Uncharacterized protein n=1 Tax=Psittacicella gerlachiana TaxID=2028574 RepID=A0A3A1Y947_9GAMM|nr:hypothetical protein [Psittacicella gerlachiana]RIY33846.1 hypothetical protein CKF59_06075 [Psittacicella gerlachiana]
MELIQTLPLTQDLTLETLTSKANIQKLQQRVDLGQTLAQQVQAQGVPTLLELTENTIKVLPNYYLYDRHANLN